MRKARRQEKTSRGDHSLSFQRYLGEIPQQAVHPGDCLQVGSDDCEMDVFQLLGRIAVEYSYYGLPGSPSKGPWLGTGAKLAMRGRLRLV
jgi:hypothetical protein